MSSFSSMSKTASGIPEVYNVKKSSQIKLKYFFLKKKESD